MQSAATKRMLCNPSVFRALPREATVQVIGAHQSNVRRIIQAGRDSIVLIRSTSNATGILIDHQHRIVTSQRFTRRYLFNARNLDKNTSAEQSKNGSGILKTKNQQDAVVTPNSNSSTTGTTVEGHERTTRNKIWIYTTQFSSSVFGAVKESTQSSMNWIGERSKSSLQRAANQIREQAQTSVDTTSIKMRQGMERFLTRISSNINESTKSILYSIGAPFQHGWNYIANIWRTTPIWNRFFWWSLSAIAVYGIATTLPKELIKLAITQSTTTSTTATGATAQTPNDIEDKTLVKPEN